MQFILRPSTASLFYLRWYTALLLVLTEELVCAHQRLPALSTTVTTPSKQGWMTRAIFHKQSTSRSKTSINNVYNARQLIISVIFKEINL